MNSEQYEANSILNSPYSIRRALFPGSFDPFTIGHQSLVSRGLALADEIVIAIGINEQKQGFFPAEARAEAIHILYKDEPRVKVCTYNSLTVDFAHANMRKILPM